MNTTSSDLERWKIFVTAGLSLVNFVEQNLDNAELALILDGWLAWATANAPPGLPNVEEALTRLWNGYTQSCIRQRGPRLEAQKRIVEVFKERQLYSPGNSPDN